FQAEDGIRDKLVTGVQTCALPISRRVDDALAEVVVPDAVDGRAPRQHVAAVGDPLGQGQPASAFTGAGERELGGGPLDAGEPARSEERRVGKECGSRWRRDQWRKE